MYDNSTVQPIGEFRTNVVNPRTCKSHSLLFIVVETPPTALLGAAASQEMGFFKADFDLVQGVFAVSKTRLKATKEDII